MPFGVTGFPMAKGTQSKVRGLHSCSLLTKMVTLEEKGRWQAARAAVGRTRVKTASSTTPGPCKHTPCESQCLDGAVTQGTSSVPSRGRGALYWV